MEGGVGGTKGVSRGAELFDPAHLRWVPTGAMHYARANHTATLLPDGDTLVAGGVDAKGDAQASAELYGANHGSFTMTGAMRTARAGHTATLISGCGCGADGKVLIAGGSSQYLPGSSIASAELYDPSTGKFTATGSMAVARAGHTATLIPSGPLAGDVLVAGGTGEDGRVLASAEIYDPRVGRFSSAGSMTVARAGHTASWLGYLRDSGAMEGEILIAGGKTPAGVTSSAEVFNPGAGDFAAISSMNAARTAQAAVLMNDGRVLIAGGYDGGQNLLNSAEIFNPTDQTFEATDPMTSAHAGGAGILLNDGRALIAGGRSPYADVYNPASGSFEMAAAMRVALVDAPVVELP
jgi:hypothetical protein